MNIDDRFWSKVDKNGPIPAHRPDLGPCWLWTASLDNHGYGQFSTGSVMTGTRRIRKAHQVSWEMRYGPVPEGLQRDHLCRVRRCVNDGHLDLVTSAENTRRGQNANRAKTHCPQGHAYEGVNLYVTTAGKRVCRTCQREHNRRAKTNRRAA